MQGFKQASLEYERELNDPYSYFLDEEEYQEKIDEKEDWLDHEANNRYDELKAAGEI